MKRLLVLFLFLASISTYSQKEANFWYFGNNAALDFNSGTPVPVNNSQLNTTEGCSSFSNSKGELLFYVGAPSPNARNLTIWNRDNVPMPFSDVTSGGQTLKGDSSSSQSALTVPAPKKDDIYYLFTVGATVSGGGERGFWYYTVDMTQDGSFGDITQGPIELHDPTLKGQWSEKVTAVRADACNTFWVISFAMNGTFFAYRVDENGVDTNNPVVSSINGLFTSDPRGYLKVSPDGTKLALANMSSGAFLFDFNDVTGRVSNYNNATTPQQINTNGENAYGVEFSTSSRRMYISTGEWGGDTENLFQYDVTQTTLADVNNSRYTVHSYFNTRGALQLGPDSKIYWTSDQSQNISVINNPEELGAACNYSHRSVSLGGAIASQGLPPFLSSLLLPIEITDNATGTILNNQTIQSCEGESLTVVPEAVTAQAGSTITYEWFLDNNTTPIATSINLNIPNLTTSNAGDYRLKVSLTDVCGNTTTLEGIFTLEVYKATNATPASNIFFCDVTNNGFNNFDLQADKTPEILGTNSAADFDVVYYLTQADADANNTANALPNPYTNPTAFSNQTIYARMHNKTAPNACYDTTSFTLAVTGSPVPQTPVSYEFCDDTSFGTDTDGIVANFLLNTKDAEVLGTLDPNIYTVSYHTSPNGAQTDNTTDVIDKNNPYTNINANTQPIYVRVENVNNAACNDTSVSFNLVVNPLPVINAVVELKQCDNDTDAFADFNLMEAAIDLSANNANETFIFYESLADAQNNNAPIPNPTVYRNKTVTTDVVWARIISDKNCYRIAEVNLTVSTTGIPATFQRSFDECDDFLDIDGNDNLNNNDTDGVSTFDFSSVDAEIRALFPAVGQQINVTYYRNEADAAAEINAIQDISNYRNIGYPNTQQIYVRVDSDLDNDCLGFGAHITLTVDPVPVANTVQPIELCDDFDSGAFNDGINFNINLRNQVSGILSTQNPADFTITFHNLPEDANTGNNPIINDTSYTNQTKDNETIYVRVVNNNTGCFNDHLTFDIIIHPLPTIPNTIDPIRVCDIATIADSDTRNRYAQGIKLSQRDDAILNGRDENTFIVSYHSSQANAMNGTGALPKENYSNQQASTVLPANLLSDDPGIEILHISILNTDTGCRFALGTLQLEIYPEPNIPTFISNYESCDNDLDGDDTNGINNNISLSTKTAEILDNYPDTDHGNFKVTYHEDLMDAQTGDSPINENQYENITRDRQEIFVRVVNEKTGCVNDNLSFEIVINPLPEFTVETPIIVCLGEQTRLEALTPAAEYDYEWYKDGVPNDILSTDTFHNVTEGGIYYVKATMRNTTRCERTLEIKVDESEKPTLNEDDIVIVDDTNNSGLNTYSIKIITENQNLGIGVYEYGITNDEDPNSIISYQDEPLFEVTEGGFYTVHVRDKDKYSADSCGTASLKISVIEYPKFFTPNGDSDNNAWKIKGANSSFYPASKITIVNRHGKIVAIVPIDGNGWDGTYNGKPLPSSDYWFKIQLIDRKGKIHQHQGHFALIRR
ncbi:MAG: T9SS type B sorting domain-containing protein [Tenacibaculum sp.]